MKVGSFVGLVALAFWSFLIASYINNINYLVDSEFDSVSGREVVAIVGAFIPIVGAVNGTIYFFEDEKNELVVQEQ